MSAPLKTAANGKVTNNNRIHTHTHRNATGVVFMLVGVKLASRSQNEIVTGGERLGRMEK